MTPKPKCNKEESVLAIFSLLKEISADPSIHKNHEGLRDSLNRQAALAKLSLPECNIYPIGALNTLKRVSDKVLRDQGGFLQLDDIRKKTLSKIQKFEEAPKPLRPESRDNLRIQLAQAKAKIIILKEDLAFISERFIVALNLAQRCAAAADELTQATFKKQRLELLNSMGLRQISITKIPKNEVPHESAD